EDTLIDGLSYKLAKTASYITNRRSCTFHPRGSNIYKATAGTRVIRFQIDGQDWLDPSTFVSCMTCVMPRLLLDSN
ncbi:MAG: hypothetical protein ACKPKO_04610, partial [Candidatus Fonsibacter sp.]